MIAEIVSYELVPVKFPKAPNTVQEFSQQSQNAERKKIFEQTNEQTKVPSISYGSLNNGNWGLPHLPDERSIYVNPEETDDLLMTVSDTQHVPEKDETNLEREKVVQHWDRNYDKQGVALRVGFDDDSSRGSSGVFAHLNVS